MTGLPYDIPLILHISITISISLQFDGINTVHRIALSKGSSHLAISGFTSIILITVEQ